MPGNGGDWVVKRFLLLSAKITLAFLLRKRAKVSALDHAFNWFNSVGSGVIISCGNDNVRSGVTRGTAPQGCIWRGVRRVWPSQEVVDPQKVLQNLFRRGWTSLGEGSTLTPLTTPYSIFLLNQYIYVQLYAAYQFGNLHARYSRSVSHSQKLWPPSENLTNTALPPRMTPSWGMTPDLKLFFVAEFR